MKQVGNIQEISVFINGYKRPLYIVKMIEFIIHIVKKGSDHNFEVPPPHSNISSFPTTPTVSQSMGAAFLEEQ